MTLRNTDDCAFSSRESFVAGFARLLGFIRQSTDALIVAGGVGFSVMPEQVLTQCDADAGVWGEGEFVFPELAQRLDQGREWRDLPGLVRRTDTGWQRNAAAFGDLATLPTMSRTLVDNRRYFEVGGQAGFETKRGCTAPCIYCADPTAKGKQVRLRPPDAVAQELTNLLRQGIDHVHTCDSEFNIPHQHALDVCRRLVERGLGESLRWFAYCTPAPFTAELAGMMRRAGCVGINFGVDNGDATMLKRLRRDFAPADTLAAARLCREAGIVSMFDLLLGSPGETEASVRRTIELMKRAQPDRVGVTYGVRVYPGTGLAACLAGRGKADGLQGGHEPDEPLFYLEPRVAESMATLLDAAIGNDPRFFFFDPSRPNQNYNYNANQVLEDAIRAGHRGAYWNILRELAD